MPALPRPNMASIIPSAGVTSLSALVVDPILDELIQVVAMLSGCGFRVTAADSFAQAKAFLGSHPPAVLVTALQLGDYNGLHLVLRGKSVRPEMAAVVLSSLPDRVLLSDAEAMGATFMMKPYVGTDLRAAVMRTLARRDPDAPPIRPPFERRTRERRGLVLPFNRERRETDRRQPLPWAIVAAASSTTASV